VCRKINGGQL